MSFIILENFLVIISSNIFSALFSLHPSLPPSLFPFLFSYDSNYSYIGPFDIVEQFLDAQFFIHFFLFVFQFV